MKVYNFSGSHISSALHLLLGPSLAVAIAAENMREYPADASHLQQFHTAEHQRDAKGVPAITISESGSHSPLQTCF